MNYPTNPTTLLTRLPAAAIGALVLAGAVTGIHSAPSGAAPPPDDPSVTESQPTPGSEGPELVANPDEYTVVVRDELNVAASEGVLKNDDYTPGSYVADTYADDDPTVDLFAVFAGGSFMFKANATGEIKLPYKLFSSDAQKSATGEITVRVIPDAADHRFETPKDQALEVGPSGLLQHARVTPGGGVTLTWVSPDTEKGSVVSWAADGSFTFMPDPAYIGSVEFFYELTDDNGMVATGRVTVDVVDHAGDDDGGSDTDDDTQTADDGDSSPGNDGDESPTPDVTDQANDRAGSQSETEAPARSEKPSYTG